MNIFLHKYVKRIFYFGPLFVFVFLFGIIPATYALVAYPIAELGSCRDAKECFLYCQIPQNTPACWSYGKYILKKDVLGEQTASQEAMVKKYNISFPIQELGNCDSLTTCKAYCEDQTHKDACVSYAREKGFYQKTNQTQETLKKQQLLEKAKTELGCSSIDACGAFCQEEQNRAKCMEFAKNNGIQTSSQTQDPEKLKMLEDAKQELGCTSSESCKAVCEQNREKCMEFVRRHGLGSSENHQGTKPGNCDSEESCRKYCQEHADECKGFKQQQGLPRTGPGGCNSKEACIQYCQEHRDECKTFNASQTNTLQNKYIGPAGCKTETECKSYCQSHQTECPGFQQPPYPTYYPKPTYYQESNLPHPTYPYQQYKQSTTQPSPTP